MQSNNTSPRAPFGWASRRIAGLWLAAVMAGMAGCGGGGSDSPPSPTPPPSSGPIAASVSVAPQAQREYWGQTLQFTASALDANGVMLAPPPVFGWTTSDASLATVDTTGLVSALRPGSVIVTAAAGTAQGTSALTILGFERLARGVLDTVCAISEGRERIFCWGDAGTTTQPMIVSTPQLFQYAAPTPLAQGDIPPGARIAKVAVDRFHMCALTDAGSVHCWGDNNNLAALGNGSTSGGAAAATALAAGAVPAGVTMVDLAVGPYGGCAPGSDGRLYCWGSHGLMPDPNLATNGFQPAPRLMPPGGVPGGVKLVKVALDINVGCALGDDGKAYCWSGSATLQPVAQGAVPANVRLTQVQIGSDLPCALGDNGRIYCWGTGFGRRFGAGSSAFVSNSAPVAVSDGAKPAGVPFTAFTVGGVATAHCGVAGGKAYCWSAGYLGSLGDGNAVDHDALLPVAVQDGEKDAAFDWVAVNCAQYTCTGLASDRRFYNWGSNQASMLSRDAQARPSAVPLLSTRPTRP